MHQDTWIGNCFKLISAGSHASKLLKLHLRPGKSARLSARHADVTGGAKINFTASSSVNAASNTAYSGDVTVAGY